MKDDFDSFAINIDSDVLSQDFDDVDLYGDKYEEDDNSNTFGNEIQYE